MYHLEKRPQRSFRPLIACRVTGTMGAPMSNLPVLPIDARSKDESLSQALSRMLSEHDRALRAAEDDPHVTAVRRLNAVEAQYAPFPESIDPRLVRALGSRGKIGR